MGGSWRMPTVDECKELCMNTYIYLVPTEGAEIQCTTKVQGGITIINWTSQAEGTVKGVKFYKKGDKQTYMFVPAYGSANGGSIQSVGGRNLLWFSSLDSSVIRGASITFFDTNGSVGGSHRYFGIPVRGVLAQ